MSSFVLFNGAKIVLPGGASKVDLSAFSGVAVTGVGTVGLIGESEGGDNEVNEFTSPAAIKAFYRAGNIADAASWLSQPANDNRVPGGVTRFVCRKTNAGHQSERMLQNATAATAGVETGTVLPSALGGWLIPEGAQR